MKALAQPTRNATADVTQRSSSILQRTCACGQHTAGGECTACQRERQALHRSALVRGAGELEGRAAPPVVQQALEGASQSLDPVSRAGMERSFGHDFAGVRVHTDAVAAESARAVRAHAYTVGRDIVFGAGQYAPKTTTGRRLIAHELAHVIQQSSAKPIWPLYIALASAPGERQSQQVADLIANDRTVAGAGLIPHAPAIMRDLALEPPEDVPTQPDLTEARVQAAIRYNRASYDEQSTRLIQDIVGAPQSGRFDEVTVRLVALIQRQFGLVPADGKVGPDTYDFLIRELQAERVTPGTCLTMFQVVGPQPLTFTRTSSTQGVIDSRVEIHARFDPRCNCGDYEYRQYIAGHVELLEAAQPGVTPPAHSGCAVLDSVLPGIWVWNLDGCFQIPGGGLSRTMKEDGDTGVPAGVAGHRYGHRAARPNPSDHRDEYRPDRATGCIYDAFDVPELAPVPATPADTGDVYDWDMRFRGVIRRSDGTVVAEKWWSIISTVPIP